MTNVPKSLTGVAGEYYVAFLLAKSAFAVGLTGRGTPHVDVLVTNPLNGKPMAIQVKTMRNARDSNRAGEVWWKWRVGTTVLRSAGQNFYWAFVDLQEQEDKSAGTPDVYFGSSSALLQQTSTFYLDPHPKPPSPAQDVWLVIEEPDGSKYRNNFGVIHKELE